MTTIETYFKVIFAVASVLGISGALPFSKISSVSAVVEELKAQIKELETKAKKSKEDLQAAKDDALLEIISTGKEQEETLIRVIESVTPEQLADGGLKGAIKNLLVRNCGGNSCDCPSE